MQNQNLKPNSVIAFGGSRSFSDQKLVSQVVSAAVAAGCRVQVGCAIGADQAVITSTPPSRLSIFAVFGQGGVGAWRCSAVTAVSAAVAAGASITWWAGGGVQLPFVARLARRSRAALVGASAFVLFLSPGALSHSGSCTTASIAVLRHIPVFAFCSGLPPSLPGVAGSWVAGQFAGLSCWCWLPAQITFFQ